MARINEGVTRWLAANVREEMAQFKGIEPKLVDQSVCDKIPLSER
jgi:hypothetical protein